MQESAPEGNHHGHGQDCSSAQRTGNVKWFSVVKGFGFICGEEGGNDLFVHQSNIHSKGFRSLQEGEVVEFDVEHGQDGRVKAVNVTGPGGGPIQNSTSRSSSRTHADLSGEASLPSAADLPDPDPVQTLNPDQRQASALTSGTTIVRPMGLPTAVAESACSVSPGEVLGAEAQGCGAGGSGTVEAAAAPSTVGGLEAATEPRAGTGTPMALPTATAAAVGRAAPLAKSCAPRKPGGVSVTAPGAPASIPSSWVVGMGVAGPGALYRMPMQPLHMPYGYPPPLMPAPPPYFYGPTYFYGPPQPAYMDAGAQPGSRVRAVTDSGAGSRSHLQNTQAHGATPLPGIGGMPLGMHMHGPMPPMPPSMPGVAGVAGVGPIPPPMFYPHAMAPGMAMGQMSPMAYPMPVGGVGGVGGMNMAPGVELATPARSSGLQVVVHNLPWTCTWPQLKEHFRDFHPHRADVMTDPSGRSRGFGTVRFASQADAEAAIERLANSVIEDRAISVRMDRFA